MNLDPSIFDVQSHPLADLFPLLPDGEVAELADDICTYGQREPIVLLEGKVLDGRNRLAACKFADIAPVFRDYDGDDPLAFVLSHNLHRRHLKESQRAMVAARIVDWERGLNQHTAGAANLQTREAAQKLSISERAVAAARRIHEHGAAELVDAIRDGRVSVHAGEALSELEHAAQLEVLRQEERAIVARAKEIRAARQRVRHQVRLAHMDMVAEKGAASAPGRLKPYPIYYADPPWKFGVRSEVTGREKSAENHYPTMPTPDIAALMADLTAGDHPAVLFCWATNPMLLDGLAVLEACGFTYVHHWVWDKQVAGTGYWGRDRHEILLIGRRGDIAAPLPGSQPETVHAEPKGRHSAKPDFYAETIELLFPGIARVEIFARSARPGWDVWGFESDKGFQAKTSEDNGATGQGAMQAELTDSMAGEVSRVDAGRTASATSERMDATAGETAPNSASDGRPRGGKRLQVLRGPNDAAEPDVVASTRERASMERGIDPCVTAGETATDSKDPKAPTSSQAQTAEAGAEPPPSAPASTRRGRKSVAA